jgi:hypothetical protein
LSSLTNDFSLDEVVGKVREGRSAGGMMMMSESKMPRFPYLSTQEVAAAYHYLDRVDWN